MYRNAYIDLASDRAMEFLYSTRHLHSVVGAAMAYAHGHRVYDRDSSEPFI
jgi:hypothetical protein